MGWPMNLAPDGVARRLEAIRREATAAGRQGTPQAVQVRLEMGRVDVELVAAYEAAGVTELVMHVASSNVAKVESAMEAFAGTVLALRSADSEVSDDASGRTRSSPARWPASRLDASVRWRGKSSARYGPRQRVWAVTEPTPGSRAIQQT